MRWHPPCALAVVVMGALAIAPSTHGVTRARLVKAINPSDASLVGIGKGLYFGAYTRHGDEPWKSDGTPAGTYMVKNIYPDPPEFPQSSEPRGFTDLNGTIFFGATDDQYGPEIWHTDGTPWGTRRLTHTPDDYDLSNLTKVAGRLFFSRNYYALPCFCSELWKTDGTRAGTKPVYRDFRGPGPFVEGFRGLNGRLLFTAYAQRRGHELWQSDGSREGTRLLKDINRGRGGSYPSPLGRFRGKLFFEAVDRSHGRELWETDGTRAGTKLFKNIARDPGDNVHSSGPSHLETAGERFFFSAFLPDTGHELWKSDGTRAGTKLVKDIYPGERSSEPRSLASIGGKVFFEAEDPIHGRELWKSDGTRVGTKLVKDITPGDRGFASGLRRFDGGVLFAASDPSHGGELWWSDGTRRGTRLVEDINPGTRSSDPRWPAKAGHAVFFEANDGAHGSALWKAVP